jgi:hypothetical protein
MTNDTRAAITDLAVLGVATFAAYYIARTPPLRRMAWRLIKFGLFTAGPTIVRNEVTKAWAESADPVRAARA